MDKDKSEKRERFYGRLFLYGGVFFVVLALGLFVSHIIPTQPSDYLTILMLTGISGMVLSIAITLSLKKP